MLRLIWTAEARADVKAIVRYVAASNPKAAQRLRELFGASAEMLPLHPFMYRQGRSPGTREAVVHPNYILDYRVSDASIDIVAVLHARQNYP